MSCYNIGLYFTNCLSYLEWVSKRWYYHNTYNPMNLNVSLLVNLCTKIFHRRKYQICDDFSQKFFIERFHLQNEKALNLLLIQIHNKIMIMHISFTDSKFSGTIWQITNLPDYDFKLICKPNNKHQIWNLSVSKL